MISVEDVFVDRRDYIDAFNDTIERMQDKQLPAATAPPQRQNVLVYYGLGGIGKSIIDRLMWSEDTGLWSDVPVVGGGDSVRAPTLDGVLGALVTEDQYKAMRALEQLTAEDRFAAPYGLAYVARQDRSYRPDGYWRGSAWMQMNYLSRLAASRWKREDICDAISRMSLDAVDRSQFAGHWNPETGEGHGAIPLTWSALVVKM